MSNSEIKEKPWQEKNLFNKLVYSWIIIPLGIVVILLLIIAVNQIFKAIDFVFPANVASMLIVSIVLIAGNYLLPKKIVDFILNCLNPAVNFLMSWMIIFFLPPLITIFNSAVFPSGWDIVKLIIVFFVGLVIFIPLVGYAIHFFCVAIDNIKKKKSSTKKNEPQMVSVVIEPDNEMKEVSKAKTNTINENITSDITINMNQKFSTHRPDDESIPSASSTTTPSNKSEEELESKSNTKKSCLKSFSFKSSAIPSKYCVITYIVLFIVAWIPAIAWDVMQPLHITINVLCYFIGLCVPDKIRIIFHPLISCTVFSYAGLWLVSLVFGRSFSEELDLYSNGSKYLLYINDTSLPTPEASEILFTILDATVVALSFKIFEHHKLIVKHLLELVGSILVMSFVSMLVHTLLCRLLSIEPIYALSMTSRSATTPLAVQVVDFLHSDMAIAIVIVAFTGVFTDILGLPLLKLIHFPLEDSLAHGACMGCAGHAVATAGLIKDFPSASAVSSISFVLFSTFCVIWSCIPPIASMFQTLAGM